jgi:WASH complex subunit strumpellin
MNATKKLEKLLPQLLTFICMLGQAQLIRRQIAHLLRFNCQMDAHLLYQALDTFNTGVVNDIRRHYNNPTQYSYPSKENPILPELTKLLESCGMDDPLSKIYVTSHPLEGLPVLLLMLLVQNLPKVMNIIMLLFDSR